MVENGLNAELVKRFPGPELAELHELASTPGTWLAALLTAWEDGFSDLEVLALQKVAGIVGKLDDQQRFAVIIGTTDEW